MYNTIFTEEEYLAQGFTREEYPMINRHDELFNKYKDNEITEEEKEEMWTLAKKLNL